MADKIVTIKNLRSVAAYSGDMMFQTTAEVMSLENPIIEDMHFQQENTDNGNKSRERSKMPEVTARKYNQGITRSSGGVKVIVDPRTELVSKLELDESYLDDFGGAADAELADEQAAHRTANGEKVGNTIFYGSRGKDSLYGLTPRYNTLDSKYASSKYVLDASEGIVSPSNLASLWIVSWGPKGAYGFFPKSSKGGLEEGELMKGEIKDEEGKEFPGYKQYFKWKLGLTVKDYRSVVRIANIDTVKAKTKNVTAGVPDLEALIVKALRLIKPNGGRVVMYGNMDIMQALDLQALGRYGQSYPTKEFANGLVTVVKGMNVRQQDCLLSSEEQVVA
jgi:hypothetical protein